MNPIEDAIKAIADKTKNIGGGFTKFFAIIGMISILGFLSIGIIRLGPDIIKTISRAAVSLSGSFVPAPKIVATSSQYTVASGENFTISWKFSDGEEREGSYMLSYPCKTGMHIELTQNTGTSLAFCNTYVNFLEENKSVTLRGFTNPREPITFPITIYFSKNGSSGISTQTSLDITLSGSVSSPIVITPTKPVQSTNQTPTQTNTQNSTNSNTPREGQTTTRVYPVVNTDQNPYGVGIDLTARILETGVVSTTTGQFTQKKTVHYLDRTAIRFEVINVGSKTSTNWTFALVLPTFPEYTFFSELQQPLAPGDKIQYTIAFDSIKREKEVGFTINVDNTGAVNDTNRDNNIQKGKISVDIENH